MDIVGAIPSGVIQIKSGKDRQYMSPIRGANAPPIDLEGSGRHRQPSFGMMSPTAKPTFVEEAVAKATAEKAEHAQASANNSLLQVSDSKADGRRTKGNRTIFKKKRDTSSQAREVMQR